MTANQTVTAPKVKATTGVETPQVTGLTNKTWDQLILRLVVQQLKIN